MKPICLVTAPVATRSGYGAHARDLVKSLINMDKYDIKIIGLPFAPAVLPGSGSSNRHAANWTFGTTYKVEADRLEGYTYGGNSYIDLLVPSNGGTGTMLKSNQIDQNTCQFWCTATFRV